MECGNTIVPGETSSSIQFYSSCCSDSGAISDSMGIVHGGGRTSTKAAMYLKQMATMSYARMIGIFIVLERLDTLRRRV